MYFKGLSGLLRICVPAESGSGKTLHEQISRMDNPAESGKFERGANWKKYLKRC